MAYVNDAQTLANVVGGAAAAQQMGIQNDAANEEQQIKNQVAAGQAPAEIQKPGLANLYQQAQTGETNARTQGLNLSNQGTAATQPGAIAATNSGNQLKISKDQADQLGTVGTMAGQIAGMMDGVPEAARPAAMAQIAQKYGFDVNQFGPQIASGDPDALRQVSQKAVQASSAYQTEQLKQTGEYNKATDVATISGNKARDVAQTQADVKRYVSDNVVAARKLSQTTDQAIATLGNKIAAAGTNADPNDVQLMHVLQEQQIAAHQMMAQNTAQLVGQGGIGQAPTFTPSGSSPAPSAPVTNAPATKDLATSSFGSYEPDKYDYGVNPSTGKFARRPK